MFITNNTSLVIVQRQATPVEVVSTINLKIVIHKVTEVEVVALLTKVSTVSNTVKSTF